MPINIDQWHVTTGLFYGKVYAVIPNNKTVCDCNMKILIFLFFLYSAFVFLILLMDGDIESNTGPKTKKRKPFFSCCHWNLNSLLAHNKLSMLEAYNVAHKYDVICISESYLDSTVPLHDNSLSLNGYNLPCADHPDVKRGGVCMYYKENLSLRIISTSYFDQCLLCEVTCQNEKGYIAVIYHSPSQSCSEFEDSLLNLEKLINQIKQLTPSFTII